jgi:hypothetical protein
MTNRCITFAAAAILGATFLWGARSLYAQPVTEPTKGSPLLVEVKLGEGATPATGTGNTLVDDKPAPPNVIAEPKMLTVKLTNVSGKLQEGVALEYGMYKLDQTGELREMVRNKQKLSLSPLERKFLVVQGWLLTTADVTSAGRTDQFYGWFLKVSVDGEPIYERFNPKALKDKLPLKKSEAKP